VLFIAGSLHEFLAFFGRSRRGYGKAVFLNCLIDQCANPAPSKNHTNKRTPHIEVHWLAFIAPEALANDEADWSTRIMPASINGIAKTDTAAINTTITH
jgi:hypothetical protein